MLESVRMPCVFILQEKANMIILLQKNFWSFKLEFVKFPEYQLKIYFAVTVTVI